MEKEAKYPTFYETIVNSPQWIEWVNYNEQIPTFDVHESMETGWLSPEHFQAFMNFYTNNAVPKKRNREWERKKRLDKSLCNRCHKPRDSKFYRCLKCHKECLEYQNKKREAQRIAKDNLK